MKKNIQAIFTILLISLLASSFSFAASTDDDNNVKTVEITLLNQNPDPVYAGDIVELTLSLVNTGYGALDNVQLTLEDEYPFSIVSEKTIDVGQVLSGTGYEQTKKVKVKINNNAEAGDYVLTIYEKRNGASTEHPITISVASNKNVEIVHIDKNTIIPGSTEEVVFTLKNVGSTDLRNLEFSWQNEDDILLPVNGDNKVFIEKLDTDEETQVSFLISASSAASADLYKLDLTVSYENTKTSEVTEESSSAGMYVGGETEFDITFDEVSYSEYIFTIANIGANDASSVKVTVEETSGISLSSKASEIIGDLNTGDYTTISFELSQVSQQIPFKIEYTDTSGKRISVSKEVSVKTSTGMSVNGTSTSRPSTLGNTSNSGSRGGMGSLQTGVSTLSTWAKYAGYFLVAVLLLFVAFKMYKKRIAKAKKN